MNVDSTNRHLKIFKRSSLLILLFLAVGLATASGSTLQQLEWQIHVVDVGDETSNDVGKYSSIALDAQNVPYISYYDIGNGDLKFAILQPQENGPNSTWAIETVDRYGDVGQYSSLAIDAGGLAHISYYDDSTHNLKYAFRVEGGGWFSETVDSAGDVGRFSSLALDTYGHPHISYYDAYPNYDLKYAYYDGSEWIITNNPVDGTGRVGQYTSLDLDSSGYPHISYFDEDLTALKYARKTTHPSMPGGWLFEYLGIGQDQYTGGISSLALDRQDAPHIAFVQQIGLLTPTFELNYAYWDGMWQTEIVDVLEGIQGQVSLTLNRSGLPYIGYYDDAAGNLKYAYLSSSGWNIDIVDEEGDVGSYPSVAMDRFGLPHISYRDNTPDIYDLKYATLPYVLHEVYFPFALQDWVRYFTWFHELEDNDAAWQANGALLFGQEYIGYHNDEDDFYSVYTRAGNELTIDLDTDYLDQDDSGYYVVQLMLYYGSTSPENRVARVFEPPYQIEYSGSAGWYYVRVYTAPGYLDGSQEYRLTITTP